jgi:GDP-L-fucose synthase
MNYSKLLITGGTGFVGKHLQEELTRRGVRFVVFGQPQCDLTNGEQTDAMFREHADSDAIVHMACMQAAADFPAKHTADQLRINSLIHLNVLASWRNYLPGAKFIGIGSSCAYPALNGAIREDRAMEGEIHGSVYAYAFTKRLLLTGIRAFNDQYKLDGTYLIPATMFGEFDDFHEATAHVTGALIGRFVAAAIEHRPTVQVWGDGSQVRDFLDVKDFVAALLHLLPLCSRDVINIGPGRGISIRQLATMIQQASGFKGEVVYKPSGYVGVQEKFIDVAKLNTTYQFQVSADHAKAIGRTVAWYRDHYLELRGKRKFVAESPRIAG